MERMTLAFGIGIGFGVAFTLSILFFVKVAREFVNDLRFAVEFDAMVRDMQEEEK